MFFRSQQRRAHSTLRQSLPLEGLLQNLQGDDERKHISIPSQKQQHRRKAHAHNTDGGTSTSSHSQHKRVHRAHCPSPPLEDQHKKKITGGEDSCKSLPWFFTNTLPRPSQKHHQEKSQTHSRQRYSNVRSFPQSAEASSPSPSTVTPSFRSAKV